MHWSSEFIGIPWLVGGRTLKGVDCYGLAWLAMRARGIEAPSYAGEYCDDREKREIEALIHDRASAWLEIPIGEEQELDLLVFRSGGYDSHVALYIGGELMLNIRAGGSSALERYRGGKRLVQVLRYRA